MNSLLLLATAWATLAATPSAPAPTVTITPAHDFVRVVVIGDTGKPGPLIPRWRAAIKKETKDAILVAGDLIYPQAPPCPTGTPDAEATAFLKTRLPDIVGGLGAPVILAIGNHDISWTDPESPRERCVLAYAATQPELHLPATAYVVDLGRAVLAVVDTNALDVSQARLVRDAFAAARPGQRRLLLGHHVLKTYHDKERENVLAPWLTQYGIRPDLYLNGHAHLLQFGVYKGIPALTSATGAKPRDRPACPPSCGRGQLWGTSEPGYAVLTITPDNRLSVAFKDADGRPLWSWDEPR